MWNIKPCVFQAKINIRATFATRIIQVFFPREQVRKTRWRSDSDPRYIFPPAAFFVHSSSPCAPVDDPNYAYRKLALRSPSWPLSHFFPAGNRAWNHLWGKFNVTTWSRVLVAKGTRLVCCIYTRWLKDTFLFSSRDANEPPLLPQIFIARSFLPSLSPFNVLLTPLVT